MMRQLRIGDKYCYDDWGVYLQAGWSLDSATAKTEYVDIPASDGALDLTETLAGEPRYNNRRFMCTFILPPRDKADDWELTRKEIESYCNGKKMDIYLPDDVWYHAIGRITTTGLSIERGYALLGISAVCEPWLYKNNITRIKMEVIDSISIVLQNDRRTVLPEIETDGKIEMTLNDVTRTMDAGTHKFTDFVLRYGGNPCKIKGNANVNISYQEAKL